MDIKTRFSEFWQATRKKIGTFFNKTGDSFKKILNRFRKTEKSPEESRSDNITAQAGAEQNAAAPATPMQKAGRVFRIIGIWLYRLRRFFMAIPVIWYAVKLARYNLQNLPEQVGSAQLLQDMRLVAAFTEKAAAVDFPVPLPP